MKVLEKIFGANEPSNANLLASMKKKTSPPKVRKFSQSISFDDNNSNSADNSFNQNSAISSNRRLEEFKRMIESSYKQHIETNNLIRQVTANNNETVFKNSSRASMINSARKSSLNSVDSTLLEILSDHQPNLAEPSTFRLNESIDRNDLSINTTAATVPCKVPYMSAYNIYENKESSLIMNKTYSKEEFDYHLQQSARKAASNGAKMVLADVSETKKSQLNSQTKFLSSNGSSLNTSPTSTSSNGSAKKITPDLDEVMNAHQAKNVIEKNPEVRFNETELASNNVYEIKPPETPRTKAINLNFRKNLLKASNSTPQQNPLAESMVVTPSPSIVNKNELARSLIVSSRADDEPKQKHIPSANNLHHVKYENKSTPQEKDYNTQPPVKKFTDLDLFFNDNLAAQTKNALEKEIPEPK
jgi:hypothetical protein